MRCHEKRAGIERLHQEHLVDGSVISSVAYIRFWRRYIELQRTGFPFDAVQLEDIGGLIDGCLVSF